MAADEDEVVSVDWRGALWFTGVTMLIGSLVFVACGILELVERYNLFKHARIQEKVYSIDEDVAA